MKKFIFAFSFLMFLLPFAARAELVIDVTRGMSQPMPVAIPQFYGTNQLASQIPGVVSADLAGSGLFRPINPAAFAQDVNSMHQSGPRFPEWRATGAQALITGSVIDAGGGKARVEFRLWDVFQQKQVMGMAYTTTNDNWRRIAHIIADEIYKHMTGEEGYFDSRIVYIAESGPYTKRIKRLAIMDQDGANHRYLTDGNALVLTPRFSPTKQQITYMSYERGAPRVYLYDLASGSRQVLGDFPGMTFAPRFSPDGNGTIMSIAQGGNTEIYAMDLRSRSLKRLTNDPSIDTSPSYSPDSKQIVFNSDRGGSQQIYVMNADGSGVTRISFPVGSVSVWRWHVHWPLRPSCCCSMNRLARWMPRYVKSCVVGCAACMMKCTSRLFL